MKHFQHFHLKKTKIFFHVEFLSTVLFTHKNMGKLVVYLIHFLRNSFLAISNMGRLNYYPFYVDPFSTCPNWHNSPICHHHLPRTGINIWMGVTLRHTNLERVTRTGTHIVWVWVPWEDHWLDIIVYFENCEIES